MNGGKCVKDIFQYDIFPTSNLKNKKTQEKIDFYTKEEEKTLKSLCFVKNMKGNKSGNENIQYKEIINNDEMRRKGRSSLQNSNDGSDPGNSINDNDDKAEEKDPKENPTSELDYLIEYYFPQYQKSDQFSNEPKSDQCCNGLKNDHFPDDKENVKECYTFDDYIELDGTNSNSVNKVDNNGDNYKDNKGDKVNSKADDEEPIYDDIFEQDTDLMKKSNISRKESVKIVKKRKPPNKPPRIFSNSSISSNTSTNSNVTNQSCDSPDRKSCSSCNCDFSEHDVSYSEIINTHKMSQMNIHDVNDNILQKENNQYLWVPQGLDDELVEDYMRALPLEKVPHFDNPEGIKYYNKQLIQQLPLQDTNIENIQTLTQKDGHYVDAFKRERDPEMSTGVVMQADELLFCSRCNDDIREDDVYVHGLALGNDAIWHPNCFVCCTCNELLVNLIYCFRNKEIYCTRHHAEQIKPRCHACDELIFCGEYIRTEEKAYHSQHFVCVSCEHGLSGEQHLLDEGLPICIQCYDQKFANTCHMCNQTIGVDEDDVMYDEEHWHDYCLVCNLCKCKLSGTSFVVKDANFLCSDCFQKTDDKRCNVCDQGFEPGAKRLELKGEYWHDTCFVCDVCKDPITSKKFIHHEGKQVCCPCFDAQFAKRCERCKEILREGGVACGGAFFHRDCFVCESCDASIANQAFQQKDGQRYCTPCYKQMYAKTCTGCGDYIVNGEFYTVESDNWHKHCFKCVSCDEILRQQTFVQENGKIKLICENCL